MIAPFPLVPSTTGEKCIGKQKCSNQFIRCKRTFESNLPVSFSIHISSKINQVSGKNIENFSDHVDKVALPDTTKFEKYIPMKNYFITNNLYITIVSISLGRLYSLGGKFLISISELGEPFSNCWIKISICFPCYIESKEEHIFRVSIKDSSTIGVQIKKPISFQKSRKLVFKII